MAAAVIVTSPAGPPTPECPIWLQANEAIVAYTQQFIDWQAAPADAAGAARVSIDTFQAIKAFAPRCMISRNGPDMLAAHGVNILEIRFTDAFWSRLLTELKASDVFASRVSDVGSLHAASVFQRDPPPTPVHLHECVCPLGSQLECDADFY